MSRVSSDWLILRGALGVFSVCVLLSGILLAMSYYFREEMNSGYQSHQQHFRNASRLYLAVDEEEKMIRDNYPRFLELYRKGVVGRENRLSWLEALRAAEATIRLPELHYQIDAQEPYKPPGMVNPGAFQIYASKMKLSVGLLHEYDFAALLDYLDKHAAGQYSVSRCLFNRLEKEIKADMKKKNIAADCDLEWFTVNLPGDGIVLK